MPGFFLLLGKNSGSFSHYNIMEQLKQYVFTDKKRRAIIAYIGFNKRYFLKKQCSADILALLLRDYFPGLIFIPKNNSGNLGILNYVSEKNGKWTIDLSAMSRCKEKYLNCLFPKDISCWNEQNAREKFGCADVIKFFTDAENKKFLHEFSKIKNMNIDKDAVPQNFFNDLDGNNCGDKPVWEDWDFSGIIMHKPPAIYEAFDYYAHRNYTLMGFCTDELSDYTEVLKSARKTLDKNIQEQFPEISKASIESQIAFFELVQEILEGTPAGQSIYIPTELNVFLKQLKSRSFGINKKDNDFDSCETYNSTERKTINNHILKIGQFVNEQAELENVKLNGSYRDKINLLHRLVMQPDVSRNYTRRELDTIHGLFLKQFYNVSLDYRLTNDENDSFTGHDIVNDYKYLQPQDRFIWVSFFKDVFEKEFDKEKLELFIECLPGHFSQFPLQIDAEGNYSISKYSRQMLFSAFCSVAGIAKEKELWKPFLVLLQQVIGNINRS